MAIMRIIGRLILQQPSVSPPPRWLSTVTEKSTATATAAAAAAQPRKKGFLFYKVVANANSKSSIADILKKWVNKGYEVKKYDIVDLSSYFRRRKNFSAALQLYDWMESSKLEMNNADHAIRIDLLCKAEGVASAEKYFNSLEQSNKTSKTYGALLGCYCREKVFDKALRIFEEIKVSNYSSTLNYNNLMSLYYSTGQPEKVISLVQEMEENNIALDLYTYNILINSYAGMKNFDAVEEVLEKMKSENVECDSFTYGNLATVYLNSGLHEKANYFLEKMEKIENEPYEKVFEAFCTRTRLYSEMNNLSGVNCAWEALKSGIPSPYNTSYLIMLVALSKMGEQENLQELFKEWEKGCSSYDFRLPNVLLEYYLSRDMIDEATSLYERLRDKENIQPNLKTLNLFAALCVKKHQIDLAMKYLEMGFDKAKAHNCKWFPTDETIKAFLSYFEESKDADRAEKFIQSMTKADRPNDFNSLLSNYRLNFVAQINTDTGAVVIS